MNFYLYTQYNTKCIFVNIVYNVWLLCPNFSGFCPNFQQFKTFGDTLTPPTPTPLIVPSNVQLPHTTLFSINVLSRKK